VFDRGKPFWSSLIFASKAAEWNNFQVIPGRLVSLPTNKLTKMKRLATDKHSSLLVPSVSDEEK